MQVFTYAQDYSSSTVTVLPGHSSQVLFHQGKTTLKSAETGRRQPLEIVIAAADGMGAAGAVRIGSCAAILLAISSGVRLVLDTSVIVAATRSDAGASRQLLVAALGKQFELLLSVPLALEYEAVLKRPEQIAVSRATVQDVDKLLDALIAVSSPVYRAFFWRPLLRDADDEMVLEAALSGNADLLVTFNKRDFQPSASNLGIALATPREALKRIKEER